MIYSKIPSKHKEIPSENKSREKKKKWYTSLMEFLQDLHDDIEKSETTHCN
jgi:hypothetical protein